MALNFGHTRVPNFARIFQRNPRLLTRNPYINFLREFNKVNPGLTMAELLQIGAAVWKTFSVLEKSDFDQATVWKKLNRKSTPKLGSYSPFSKSQIPKGYTKRNLKHPKGKVSQNPSKRHVLSMKGKIGIKRRGKTITLYSY